MFAWLQRSASTIKCTDDDSCGTNFAGRTGRDVGDRYDVMDDVQPSRHGQRSGATGAPRGQPQPRQPCDTRAGMNDCRLTRAMTDTLRQGRNYYETSFVVYDRDHMEKPIAPTRACPSGPGVDHVAVRVSDSMRVRPSPYSDNRYLLNDGFYKCLYVEDSGVNTPGPPSGYVFNMRRPGVPVKTRPSAVKTLVWQQ